MGAPLVAIVGWQQGRFASAHENRNDDDKAQQDGAPKER
jgi:hypothetical protein